MPRKTGDLSPRGHRDDAALDLHDVEHGLRDLHRRLQQQARHVAHLHTLTLDAIHSLREAQRIDDTRAAA